MTAATYNLTMDQGSDFAITFTISEDGSAKNLSTWSARAQMRPTKTSTTLSASFSCSIANAANGVILMEMGNGTTKNLTAGIYYYDLEIYTSGDASVSRLLEGQVTVTQEVTR